VNPLRTYAVVVGIERYQLEERLLGAARDATKFVLWLRKNQVPANNIHLFLSPLPENQAELERLLQSPEVGVIWQPAESTLIHNCLENLKDRQRYAGELLYLFWGGHGIADTAGNRYLFYSDTKETELHRHLDLPSWLKRLRSYGNLPQQIGYIDSCATVKPRLDLGSNKVQAGNPIATQSIFFSASIGERAANDDVTQSGHFSTALREAIDKIQAESPGWPPNPRQVIDHMLRWFSTNRTQKPVYYQAGDLQGNQFEEGHLPESHFVDFVAWKAGYMTPVLHGWAKLAASSTSLANFEVRAAALRLLEAHAHIPAQALGAPLPDVAADWARTLAVAIDRQQLEPLLIFVEQKDIYSKPLIEDIKAQSELRELVRLLDESLASESDLQYAFLHTAAPLGIRDRPGSAGEMLEKLRPAKNDRFRHAAELALRVDAVCPNPHLRRWAQKRTEPRVFAKIEAKLQQERNDPEFHVFFLIGEQQLAVELYRGRELKFVKEWPAVAFREQDAATLIDPYLSDIEDHSENLFAHFLVSLEHLSWSPQAMLVKAPGGKIPLGSAYTTLVGWLERARGDRRTGRSWWAKRAKKFFDTTHNCTAVGCGWIDETAAAAKIDAVLGAAGAEHQVVAFDFVMPRTIATEMDLLMLALGSGVPLMLWPCAEPGDRAAMRADVEQYFKTVQLERLHEEIKVLYRNPVRRPWHVTLFWDDPALKPAKWRYKELESPDARRNLQPIA
jgi:vWA-MoxR associated protein C-terminal domain/Caspase domain